MEILQLLFYVVGITSMLWISLMTTVIAGFKLYAYFKAREAVNAQLQYIPLESLLGGAGGAPGMGAHKRGKGGNGHGGVQIPGTHGTYL